MTNMKKLSAMALATAMALTAGLANAEETKAAPPPPEPTPKPATAQAPTTAAKPPQQDIDRAQAPAPTVPAVQAPTTAAKPPQQDIDAAKAPAPTVPAVQTPATPAKPAPAAPTPWWATQQFEKRFPGLARRFNNAHGTLMAKRNALKEIEEKRRLEKNPSVHKAMHAAVVAARKAVWQAEIAWLNLHIEWKQAERLHKRQEREKAKRECHQRLEAQRQQYLAKDFNASIQRWREGIRQLQHKIRTAR